MGTSGVAALVFCFLLFFSFIFFRFSSSSSSSFWSSVVSFDPPPPPPLQLLPSRWINYPTAARNSVKRNPVRCVFFLSFRASSASCEAPPTILDGKKTKKKSTMDQNLEDTIIKLASIGLEWVLLVRFLLFPDHLFLGCLLGFFFCYWVFFFGTPVETGRAKMENGRRWISIAKGDTSDKTLWFLLEIFFVAAVGNCFFFGERGGGVAPSTNRPAPSGLPPAESNKFRNGIVSKKGRPVSDSVLFFVLFCFVLFFFTQCFSFSFYDDDDDRSVSFSKRLRIARSSSSSSCSSSSSSRTPRKEKKNKRNKTQTAIIAHHRHHRQGNQKKKKLFGVRFVVSIERTKPTVIINRRRGP